MKTFALVGVGGFVAPRHLKAISQNHGILKVCHDLQDSVGIIDSYFKNVEFFTDTDEFKKYLKANKVDFLVIATPNFTHLDYILFALDNDIMTICEKPLVLNMTELNTLLHHPKKHLINVILQLRLHEKILNLKSQIKPNTYHNVIIKYFTPRGKWYAKSWKSDASQSGGLALNIGIHLFDMLCFLFGDFKSIQSLEARADSIFAIILFANAKVEIELSIQEHLSATRTMIFDDTLIDFNTGFNDLHTLSYKNILESKGFKVEDISQGMSIIESIKNMSVK